MGLAYERKKLDGCNSRTLIERGVNVSGESGTRTGQSKNQGAAKLVSQCVTQPSREAPPNEEDDEGEDHG